MTDTIELGDDWIADRPPWEDLVCLVEKLFPDPPFEDGGEEGEFRKAICAELARGRSAYWLGVKRESPPDEIMKLKQCDDAAARCNIRRSE